MMLPHRQLRLGSLWSFSPENLRDQTKFGQTQQKLLKQISKELDDLENRYSDVFTKMNFLIIGKKVLETMKTSKIISKFTKQ